MSLCGRRDHGFLAPLVGQASFGQFFLDPRPRTDFGHEIRKTKRHGKKAEDTGCLRLFLPCLFVFRALPSLRGSQGLRRGLPRYRQQAPRIEAQAAIAANCVFSGRERRPRRTGRTRLACSATRRGGTSLATPTVSSPTIGVIATKSRDAGSAWRRCTGRSKPGPPDAFGNA